MPNIGDTLCVNQIFNIHNTKYQKAKKDMCESVAWMTGPNAAKILTALATDIVTGILSRNDRPDVQAAVASLKASVAVMLAIDENLDG